MSGILIRKAMAKGRHWGTRIAWAPMASRFRRCGHGHAWRVFTHMTPQERLLLYRLAVQQAPGAILVEIGSYLGASANFLAAAASEVGGGATVHCVDTWENQGMAEGLRDTWGEFQANTRAYAAQIKAHRGRSVDVARSFGKRIDLLFLDGDHSYEGCRTDVEVWLPLMKPNGVLVMHDYGWAEGVQRVVREIIRPRESQPGRILQNTYWTRIGIDPETVEAPSKAVTIAGCR